MFWVLCVTERLMSHDLGMYLETCGNLCETCETWKLPHLLPSLRCNSKEEEKKKKKTCGNMWKLVGTCEVWKLPHLLPPLCNVIANKKKKI